MGSVTRLRAGFVALLVFVRGILGCTSSPTALVVRVDTNLQPIAQLASFEITLERDGAAQPFSDVTYDLSAHPVAFPATVLIVPHDPTDRRTLTVVVTGTVVNAPPVVQRARVSIAYGHVSVLDMYLAAECIGADARHDCPDGETCTQGHRCVPVSMPVLPDYVLDASVPRGDVSPVDVPDATDESASMADRPDAITPSDLVEMSATDTSAIDAGDVSSNDVPGDSPSATDACACGAGAVCIDASCVACGGPGEVCCPGATPCDAGSGCMGGTCHTCGAAGQACCPGATPCTTGNNCIAGTCMACGSGDAGACCAGLTCESGAACNPLVGPTGQCTYCNAPGRLCCGPTSAGYCSTGCHCTMLFECACP